MLPDNLKPISWSFQNILDVKYKYKDSLSEQIENCLSTQQLRDDQRDRETIARATLVSLLTELSVSSWLDGERNRLTFNANDPYSYAWDVFALGRRIEVKKFSSRNFNINTTRRGGGCVDMHTFETFDVSELLFACKTHFDRSKSNLIVSPAFLMDRNAYFNCRVKSERNAGYYLQYDNEARTNENCKVYK
ncbi:MAG: hypothetical protein [Caudoviricetes sp.]|nr:MAG: hypothetical protein [Caudoviricetes sp.]